ncbi:DNA cytosine methyltransferase [Spectribacter hydrogenooxidans]|uniref:DNA (cytosine-5-)-methyltransferase n=1 Tax=Spectribacter hydrogenoxidans TaxID=3075608 RepID=A0ABU3C0H3_9GAMM|nr:DNA cytosine methyltransferase [Salinisphaera sp. W335]MDT0635062.1 DNA cytosine methyltransferase [Salinisphaera sp. W335]
MWWIAGAVELDAKAAVMTGNRPQLPLNLGHELVIDLFAGGGGTSIGLEQALGRPVDIAVNHDPQAVSMHRANHPDTEHFCESVFKVNPVRVTRGLPVGLLWASPDCTHHSKAKGGKPASKKIRGLAWVVVKWARRCRPRVIMLENVEEFQDWGPLGEDGRPCKRRKGQQFDEWVHQLERLGYRVEYKLLRACDYGAPTIRRRLFVVARRDGRPIAWPQPTHAPADDARVKRNRLQPYRTAAECIDWSIPAPSIFTRKRPLADNTLRRIAKGVQRFVLDAAAPYIVRIGQTGWRGDGQQYPIDDPLTTITTKAEHLICTPFIAKHREHSTGSAADAPLHTITAGGHQAKRPGTGNAMSLAVPYFIPRHGEAEGQAPRTRDVNQPMPTVTATANGASLVAAFMEQANTGVVGHAATKPVSTIVGKGSTQRLVAAHISRQFGASIGSDAQTPVGTVTAGGGGKSALVAALMAPYYGSGSGETGRDLRQPAPTATTKDRLQLVTVDIDGETWVLTDIGMRMLQPRELYRAQGFPESYIIDRGADGEALPKHAQVRMCGNSVCPPVAAALAQANFVHELEAAA